MVWLNLKAICGKIAWTHIKMAYNRCREPYLLLNSEQDGYRLPTRSGRIISNVLSITQKAECPKTRPDTPATAKVFASARTHSLTNFTKRHLLSSFNLIKVHYQNSNINQNRAVSAHPGVLGSDRCTGKLQVAI